MNSGEWNLFHAGLVEWNSLEHRLRVDLVE
jgi:hypothetical protein